MEIIIVDGAEEGARVVADRFEQVLRETGGKATLGLATGSSPVAAYRELIRRHREEGLSFAGTRAFLLDEYVGLAPEAPQSYHRFIRENLTRDIDIDDAAISSPRGEAADPVAEAARYDASIREAGGVDLQILGIGSDGHIGFNEPTSSLSSRTRVKTLTPQTVEDNARFFDSPDDVPRHVLTQGIGTILEARAIVLTASGENKARAVAEMVEGPISARWPATALQLHPRVVVVLDPAAASQLELADYYRYVQDNKRGPVA
ncbi:glucosamine-6-phosphate deaminase [Brachybacterium huguangmaarense]